MKITNLNSIVEKINADLSYGDYGVRVMTKNPVDSKSSVETIENSYNWVDGITTNSEIDGTSAITIEVDHYEGVENIENLELTIVNTIETYGSDCEVVILGGTNNIDEPANDPCEIILKDASVISTVEFS